MPKYHNEQKLGEIQENEDYQEVQREAGWAFGGAGARGSPGPQQTREKCGDWAGSTFLNGNQSSS